MKTKKLCIFILVLSFLFSPVATCYAACTTMTMTVEQYNRLNEIFQELNSLNSQLSSDLTASQQTLEQQQAKLDEYQIRLEAVQLKLAALQKDSELTKQELMQVQDLLQKVKESFETYKKATNKKISQLKIERNIFVITTILLTVNKLKG